ncbi:MAG: SCO family protein [Gemmatimonadales bacterium]|jgi:protein SCO1/2
MHVKHSRFRDPFQPGRRLAVLAGGVCLFLLAACAPEQSRSGGSRYRGWLMPQPQEKVDFTLSDTDGEPFDFRAETDGYVTLLFFGYTYCPDVCPIHMANIGAVLDDLPFEIRRQIKVVFVTTDPERDTPERLRHWLDNFDTSFIGLRGSRDEVNQIQVALGLPASVIEESEGDDYLVGHSARVLAFTKDSRAHLAYPFGTRQADWAHDLPMLVDERWE